MSEKKNDKVAAAAMKATELTPDKATAKKLNGGKAPDRQDPARLISIAQQAAGHPSSVGNWKFKNADSHFPVEPLLRRVDKYFQFAKGGPLYVDEPRTELEIKGCKRKAAVMAKEGLRYCYITKEMKLADALKQLEPQKKASA